MNEKVRKIPHRRQLSNFVFTSKVVWRHSKMVMLVYFLKALADGLNPTAQAFLIGALINELVEATNGVGSKAEAATFILLSAGLQMAYFGLRTLENYIFVSRRELLQMEMMTRLMEERVGAKLDYVEIPRVKDEYELASRGANESLWYIRYVGDIFAAVVGVIAVTSALLLTTPYLLIVLLPLPFLNVRISIKNFIENRVYWEDRRSHRVRINMIENMFQTESGILEIKIFGRAKKLLKFWQGEYRKTVEISMHKEYLAARQGALLQFIEAAVGVAVDIWLMLQVFAAKLTLGAFEQNRRLVSSFILSLNQFSEGISSLTLYGYHIDDYRRFVESTREYGAKIEGQKKIDGRIQTVIASNLSYAYPTADAKALEGVDIEINRGQTIAIVGENGAGKTSLIKCLLGLYDLKAGEVTVNDINIRDISRNDLYEQVATLSQHFYHYDFLTIGQSVSMSFNNNYDKKRVWEAIDAVGLRSDVEALPKQLDTNYGYVEDDGLKVSGGQAQRLAIARVLYSASELLVLDEPTSAIDAKSEQEIMDHIFELYKDKTLVVVSHRLSTVSRCDRIAVMKNGSITEVGTHKELFKKGTDYHDLFHKQSLRIK